MKECAYCNEEGIIEYSPSGRPCPYCRPEDNIKHLKQLKRKMHQFYAIVSVIGGILLYLTVYAIIESGG